jgi:nitrite reductase/ring-hydroxylating ferredoxin subunit
MRREGIAVQARTGRSRAESSRFRRNVFSAARVLPVFVSNGAWRYLTENFDYPFYLLRDRLAPAEGDSVDDLKVGEGKILRLNGKKVAAFRDENGKVNLLSPVCTHMRCIVRWNATDRTWDCPCHGSGFKPGGEVFSGPAEDALEKISWPK